MKSSLRKIKFKIRNLHFNSKILLFFIVFFLSIGFASLSTELGLFGKINLINAGWNIYFNNIKINTDSVSSISSDIIDKTEVDFSFNLENIDDYYSFTIDAVNDGRINAMIDLINNNSSNEDNLKYLDIDISYGNGVSVSKYDLVPAGDNYTYTVKITYKKDLNSDELPTDKQFNLSMKIDYVKDDGNGVEPCVVWVGTNKFKFSEDTTTDGLYRVKHTENDLLEANSDYRYIGKNPKNYIMYNDELWRIVGIFPTKSTDGVLKNRLKIVKNDYMDSIQGNSTNTNEWVSSTINLYLNSEYYDSLTDKAKRQIAKVDYYLGGMKSGTKISDIYNIERSKTIDLGNLNPILNDYVGLLYGSDYYLATSGSSDEYYDRDGCLNTNSIYGNCLNNDWIYTGQIEWFMTRVYSIYSEKISNMDFGSSSSSFYRNTVNYFNFRPSVYLNDSVILNGTGTLDDPYIISEGEIQPDKSKKSFDGKYNDSSTSSTINKLINSASDDVNTKELYIQEQPISEQVSVTEDYRYIGSNPNNHIHFNNESWRIIGIFETEDGNGSVKKRIKIIRENFDFRIGLTSSLSNDLRWDKSLANYYLNYYYFNSLEEKSGNAVATVKYPISFIEKYDINKTSDIYLDERQNGDNSTYLDNIGLMLLSDYRYAFGDNNDGITRDNCLNNHYSVFSYSSNCKDNWMSLVFDGDYTNSKDLTMDISDGSSSNYGISISKSSIYTVNNSSVYDTYFRPVVYLKSDVELSGSGTEDNPYKIIS